MMDAIIGMGQSGQSLARFLSKQQRQFEVFDSRKAPSSLRYFQQHFPEINLHCGDFSDVDFSFYDHIYISPGVDPRIPSLQKVQAKLIGDVELFLQHISTPVIAITGSNGKTTVTELVGAMAKAEGINAQVAGNVGTPVLDLLPEPAELFVLELSSFQLETIETLKAEAATCLNISPDHMDRYGSYRDYQAAKLRIYHHAKHAVVNVDDPDSQPKYLASEQTTFSTRQLADFYFHHGELYGVDGEPWCHASELQLTGLHQISNVLAAFALGYSAGFSKAKMIQTAKQFAGLSHRCQKVAEQAGVLWVNDSKATNVGATCAAIESIGEIIAGKIMLIAGGDAKGAEFSAITDNVAYYCRDVITLGKDAEQIEFALPKHISTHRVNTLEQAVEYAVNHAQSGDCVLLSPACASWDMFDNYQQRGNVFMEAVQQCLK